MSVAEIQNAVQAIRELPAEERVQVYSWTESEIEGEAECALFESAMASGAYNAIIKETLDDLHAGRALDSIY